jgi:hypothetical protein
MVCPLACIPMLVLLFVLTLLKFLLTPWIDLCLTYLYDVILHLLIGVRGVLGPLTMNVPLKLDNTDQNSCIGSPNLRSSFEHQLHQ